MDKKDNNIKIDYDVKYPDINPKCTHKWGYGYQIISGVKNATFDIYKCDICNNYKMERKDKKTNNVLISFHKSSPKDTDIFGKLGGYEPFEYFEM